MVSRNEQFMETDVLIIGGGIAGCLAAIRARKKGVKVILVDKGNVGRSGFSPMMSGVLTYFDPEKDDPDAWFRECIGAGEGLVDQDRLSGMVAESHTVIEDMVRWGVTFQKQDHEFIRMPCVGMIHARNILMTNSGFQMMSVIRGEVIRLGVRVFERVMMTDLLSSDGHQPTNGRVVGAMGFNIRTGKSYLFSAKTVIIATGATHSILPSGFYAVLSGDGKAMALRAGCEMRNVELSYFTPRPVGQHTAPGLSIFVGEGAVFVNAKGERFLPKWDPIRNERANRAIVGKAIATEIFEGRGPVYLDATHLDKSAYDRMEKCIPIILQNFAIRGLDVKRHLISYSAVLTDLGPGGIRADKQMRTTLEGLYTCGAASDHAEDGASNVISQGMESAIEGCRAGSSASEYASQTDVCEPDQHQVQLLKETMFEPLRREKGVGYREIRSRCMGLFEKGLLGPIKTEERLKIAMDATQEIRETEIPRLQASDYHELSGCIGVGNALFLIELFSRCSLMRKESRGGHFRADFPERDDSRWKKWVIAKLGKGGIRVWTEPLPKTWAS